MKLPKKTRVLITVILLVGVGLIALALVIPWISTERANSTGTTFEGLPGQLEQSRPRVQSALSGTPPRETVVTNARAVTQDEVRAEPAVSGGASGAASNEMAQVEAANDFLDEEDLTGALKVIRRLMKSSDPEIRSEAVSLLGWIGVRAVAEIADMLTDDNDAVAWEAVNALQQQLGDIEDDAAKASLLTRGLMALKDQEQMEAFVMEFSNVSDELAVRSLVQVMTSPNKVASEVAREHYEFVTGDAYVSPAEAEKWIEENSDQE